MTNGLVTNSFEPKLPPAGTWCTSSLFMGIPSEPAAMNM